MSRTFSVAVVGATGTVGREILQLLEERKFPVGELRLFASEGSDGEMLTFADEEILVEPLKNDSFGKIEIAIFSAGAERSREFCPAAVAAGAVCIDTSSAWRLDPDVPLVVPEVNPDELARYAMKGIVANPSSATIQMAVALKPLSDFSRIRRVVVSTYQAVSESGQKAIDELRVQTGELLNGRPAEAKVYPHQIAFNCLPHVDSFLDNGYTAEETELICGTRKIFGDESMRITATAVRVPVFYGHSESINVEFETPLSAEKARELLAEAPGLALVDDLPESSYPVPLDAAGQDEVLVGRIRQDESCPNALNLWAVADNLRKGTATNAVQIAELLAEKYLLR